MSSTTQDTALTTLVLRSTAYCPPPHSRSCADKAQYDIAAPEFDYAEGKLSSVIAMSKSKCYLVFYYTFALATIR